MSGCPFHARHDDGAEPPKPSVPLSTRLKSQTQSQHDAAEHHPFQFDIMSGSAGLEPYRRWIGQLAAAHMVLEPCLRTRAADSPVFGALVRPHHFHLEAALADLEFLGGSASDLTPLPATQEFCDLIARAAQADTHDLLGVFYVLEGSTNGGTIIAKGLRNTFGWTDDRGTRFTNPHGPLTRPRWMEFKAVLDGLELPAPSQNAIVAAAKATFAAVTAILTDLQQARATAGLAAR